jgi:hypothetical protein
MRFKDRINANRLFLSDVGVAVMVSNQYRRRLVARVFGLDDLTRNESLLITLLALGAVAKVVEEATPSVNRPGSPSAVDAVIGGTLIGDAVHALAGIGPKRTPGFAALIAFALIYKYHPLARAGIRVARESVHAVEASERRIERVYGAHPARQG